MDGLHIFYKCQNGKEEGGRKGRRKEGRKGGREGGCCAHSMVRENSFSGGVQACFFLPACVCVHEGGGMEEKE